DGIRDGHVTGVQTCALPIYPDQDGHEAPGPRQRRVTAAAVPHGRGRRGAAAADAAGVRPAARGSELTERGRISFDRAVRSGILRGLTRTERGGGGATGWCFG